MFSCGRGLDHPRGLAGLRGEDPGADAALETYWRALAGQDVSQEEVEIKGRLRKAEARSRKTLLEAMGVALCAVSARDARGFFGHCGYGSMGQLL